MHVPHFVFFAPFYSQLLYAGRGRINSLRILLHVPPGCFLVSLAVVIIAGAVGMRLIPL